jgi:transposase
VENNLQIPLDLPDVRVLKVSKIEKGAWLILVESTVTGTPCRKCGKPTTDYHGLDTSIRLRHLPLFEIPVYILTFHVKCYQGICDEGLGNETIIV